MHAGHKQSTRPSSQILFMNRLVNPIMRAILRSPLHGMLSKSILLLTYTGKRSGRGFTLPVEYVADEETVFILVGYPDQKKWWRNLRGGAQVRLLLRGHPFTAQAEVTSGQTAAVIRGLQAYFKRFPASAKARGLQPGVDGNFARADLDRAAVAAIIVQLTVLKPA